MVLSPGAGGSEYQLRGFHVNSGCQRFSFKLLPNTHVADGSIERTDSLGDEAPFEQIELVACRILSAPPQDGYLGGRCDIVPRSERAFRFTRSPFDLVLLHGGVSGSVLVALGTVVL